MSKSLLLLLPPLLNEELIQQTLQNFHQLNNNENLKLKTCSFNISNVNGENFSSDIYQVQVHYEVYNKSQQISFIIKVMKPEEVELGSNEKIMLKTILPEMENYLNNVTYYNKLHAKCLLSKREPNEFYVLENLNTLGYHCADRSKGLDFQHAKILMEKIAKLHASSMMFNKNCPQIVNSMLVSQFQNGANDESSEAFIYGGFEYVANMIKSWPSYVNLADKVLSIIPKYNELVFEVVNPQNSKFNVINHGDLWINNFLYKFDKNSEKPIDVVFVDFQHSFWGSCGFDLNWFLNSSLQLEVLKDKRQNLIEIYYETLRQSLEAIDYSREKIPSLEDVLFEVKRCEFIGFYVLLCEFPIFALDKSQSQKLDSSIFFSPEKMKDSRKLLYHTNRVKDTLKYGLNYFEKINLFEI